MPGSAAVKRDIPLDKNKQELTKFGSPEFPIAVYENYPSDYGLGFINWHWHNGTQFCLITSGKIAFHVNSEVYNLECGQGIFINCGHLHMIRPQKSNDGCYICVNFDNKLISLFHNSSIESKYVLPYMSLAAIVFDPKNEGDHLILQKIKKIYELSISQDFGYEMKMVSELLLMWKETVELIPAAPWRISAVNPDPIRIKTILSYINEHYDQRITLKDISTAVNISREECCRYFKRVTNCNIVDYLNDYRINKSIELLQFSDMSITQIAFAVGFGSISYFCECFKKRLNCTPSQYKGKMK